MNSTARRTIASVFAAGIAVTGATAPANAAEQTQGDGLIQVQIGDITITDAVDIGVAAQVAAQICGVKVGPVAVLGVAADRSGRDQTVCTTECESLRRLGQSHPTHRKAQELMTWRTPAL